MDAALDGAIAVVTGGARGIGAATARELAEHGARVCIADLDLDLAQQLADEIGAPTFAQRVDVTSSKSIQAMIAAVDRRWGTVDLMVANAGIMPTGAVVATSLEVDRIAMEVNHFGVVRCVQAVLPNMLEQNAGTLVVVASLAGRLPIAGLAAYVASKHAIVGWTASLREELVGTGIRVATILPTAVRTRLSDGLPTTGLATVSARDVAQTIVSASTGPSREYVVPPYLNTPSRLDGLVTGSVRTLARKLLGARRLLTADRAERTTYDQSIADQIATLDPHKHTR